MDAAAESFAHIPLMLGLMMAAVLLLIGGSFRSVVAPIRAIFCLLWMLAVTMGINIFTFQNGLFDWLNWPQLAMRETGE